MYTVVATGSRLNGRPGPSTSNAIVRHGSRGFERYASRSLGGWVRTRYGTWYHTDHLTKGPQKRSAFPGRAAGIRVAKTAIGVIAASAGLADVTWPVVASASAKAGYRPGVAGLRLIRRRDR